MARTLGADICPESAPIDKFPNETDNRHSPPENYLWYTVGAGMRRGGGCLWYGFIVYGRDGGWASEMYEERSAKALAHRLNPRFPDKTQTRASSTVPTPLLPFSRTCLRHRVTMRTWFG
jgi:hypothetical protein